MRLRERPSLFPHDRHVGEVAEIDGDGHLLKLAVPAVARAARHAGPYAERFPSRPFQIGVPVVGARARRGVRGARDVAVPDLVPPVVADVTSRGNAEQVCGVGPPERRRAVLLLHHVRQRDVGVAEVLPRADDSLAVDGVDAVRPRPGLDEDRLGGRAAVVLRVVHNEVECVLPALHDDIGSVIGRIMSFELEVVKGSTR